MPDRPNILLILTDQQATDTLSLGNPHAPLHTPHLDALAARSLRCERAYCANPLCVPSRTSMFTGLHPHQTGVTSNDESGAPPDLRCASTAFPEHGYATAYFGKWHIPVPLSDPARSGFTTAANNQNNTADIRLVDHALPWLGQPRDHPFFAVASFNNPHNICEWARGARGLHLPDGSVPEPASLDACPPRRANHLPAVDEPEAVTLLRRAYHANPMFPVGTFDEAQWRRYRFAYHRMVELIDLHVGRLLAGLAHLGLAESTAVVFASDHGDCQGAHGWNQKTVLDDEAARVPFLLAWPGRIQPGVSHRLIQTGIDLLPTLFDIAGIPVPATLPGRSALSHAPRDQIVVENHACQGAAIDGTIPAIHGRMLRTHRHKYCCYDHGSHREALFDLETDPGETTNLARQPAFAAVLDDHRRRLAAHAAATHDPFPLPPGSNATQAVKNL